jgi:hypothetical protein
MSEPGVPRIPEVEAVFDAAIAATRKCARAGMTTGSGESAEPYLRKLEEELKAQRALAVERGTADRTWLQTTVRWLVEWLPETELTLIAALGRIARAG